MSFTAANKILQPLGNGGKAVRKGVAELFAKAFGRVLRAGETVDLAQLERNGRIVHERVVVAHRAGETFDLILRFRDGGLDGDDVLHILRLFEQLLQARKLDLRRFQTRLRVVILLADIFRRVVLPRHMAERAHLRAEVSELLRRHAHGIARVAITAGIVRKVLLLEVSAAALHKRGNVLHRLLVGERLHLDVRAVDHLDAALGKALVDTRAYLPIAVPRARAFRFVICCAKVVVFFRRFIAVVVARHGLGSCILRAAGGKRERQHQREQKGQTSFHLLSPHS